MVISGMGKYQESDHIISPVGSNPGLEGEGVNKRVGYGLP